MDAEPVVFLLSDKSKTRRQLAARLRHLGYDAHSFNSTEEFQTRSFPTDAGCILLCLSEPEEDLDWLKEVGAADSHWPIVVIADDADVETAVRAMKNGAFDFLLDTCGDRNLAKAIDDAFRWDAACRRRIVTVQSIRRRLERLAPPLWEVLELLLKGKSNREIAAELGLSERSIEDRRAKLMRAMKASSLAALVRQALLARGVMSSSGGSKGMEGDGRNR
jgi:two-component system, LuxR family, response regulator FixJ